MQSRVHHFHVCPVSRFGKTASRALLLDAKSLLPHCVGPFLLCERPIVLVNHGDDMVVLVAACTGTVQTPSSPSANVLDIMPQRARVFVARNVLRCRPAGGSEPFLSTIFLLSKM